MTKQDAAAKADGGASASEPLSPNDELAALVLAGLVEDSLVSAADAERLREGLAAGSLTSAEWKLAVENQLERKDTADGSK